MGNVSSFDNETVDKMLEAAKIVVAQADAELVKDNDKLEEAMDIETIQKVMAVGMGNRLNDPNE
jgi:hypothetical protein